jgi:hypothetical protein
LQFIVKHILPLIIGKAQSFIPLNEYPLTLKAKTPFPQKNTLNPQYIPIPLSKKHYILFMILFFCIWGAQLKAGNGTNSFHSGSDAETRIDTFSLISQAKAWYSTMEDRIYVNLTCSSYAKVNIQVADFHGKVVMETDARAGNGLTQLSLFMMGFAKGTYTVIISDNHGNTKKVSLLKF